MALVVYTGGQTYDADDSSDSSRYVGLSNQGATCYLNSLLQTLFMTPEFRRALFSWQPDSSVEAEKSIPLQLQRLFGLLQLSKSKAVDTVALTKSFGWEGSEVFQQQDVQELTRVLFDALEEAFKGTEHEKIVDQLYAGELIDYIRCIDVEYESERKDKFLDLSFAIIPFGSTTAMHSLSECIESFLRPELLDGDNKYFAESVGRKVDAIKGLKFGKLPQIMSCNLKRFVYDFSGASITQKKLNEVVRFPMVLDMNKYVATKKREKKISDQSIGEKEAAECKSEAIQEESEPEEVANEEFESFLREQMDLLKQSSPTEDSGGDCSPAKKKSSAGDLSDIDISDSAVDVNSKDSSMPDLVDCNGIMSEDQKAEAASLDEEKGKVEKARLDEEKASWSREEMARLVAERGEFVYELYAVLIHSGAIAGGHYYAYIKDLDTGKWWNFNDSHVTSIEEAKVREAWGGSTTYSSTYYGKTTTHTSMSCANAYMLMYRKVSLSVADRVSLPDDSQVPEYVKEEVGKLDEELKARQTAEKDRWNKIDINVLWREGQENRIPTSKTITYAALLQQLWTDLKLFDEPEFEDLKHATGEAEAATDATPPPPAYPPPPPPVDPAAPASPALSSEVEEGEVTDAWEDPLQPVQRVSSTLVAAVVSVASKAATVATAAAASSTLHARGLPGAVPLDRVRLRKYNLHTKMSTEIIDVSASGKFTLGDLYFYSYTTYVLEVRRANEAWEPYYADGLNLTVEAYLPATNSLGNPKALRFPKDATGADLYDKIAKLVSFPRERLRVVKCVPRAYTDGDVELIRPDDRLLKGFTPQYNLTDYSKVCYEEADPDSPVIESFAFASYVSARCKIAIKYNRPPDDMYRDSIDIDIRWTVGKLRSEMAKILGVEPSDLRMHKFNYNGQELRDDEQKLQATQLYDKSAIALVLGKALPFGFFHVNFAQFEHPQMDPKLYFLPPLPTPDQPESAQGIEAAKSGLESENAEPNVAAAFFATDGDDDDDFDHSGNADAKRSHAASIIPGDKLLDDDDLDDAETTGATAATAEVQVAQVVQVAVAVDTDEDWPTGDDSNDVQTFAAAAVSVFGVASASATAIATPASSGSSLASFSGSAAADLTSTSASSASAIPAAVATPIATTITTVSTSTSTSTETTPLGPLMEPDFLNEENVPPLIALAASSNHPSDGGEVEPNDFGELMTSLKHTASNFRVVKCLESVEMGNTSQISEIRELIATRLKEEGLLPADATAQHVRLRDRNSDTIQKYLRDGKTARENDLYLSESKKFCFQILNEPEVLPPEEKGAQIIPVRRWHRSTWSLSQCREVYLPGSMALRDIALGLSSLFDISEGSIRVLVISTYYDPRLSDLAHAFPKGASRAWFNPLVDKTLLKDLYLSGSHTLVLQDCSEELRELTPQERMSVELVDAANRTTSSYPYNGSYGSSNTKLYSSTYTYSKPAAAGGIKIKVHKAGNSSSDVASSGGVPTVAVEGVAAVSGGTEGAEGVGGGGEAGEGVFYDAQAVEVSQAEVSKHGGMALFSDLA